MNAHVPQTQEQIPETESEWKVRTKIRLKAESRARHGRVQCHYCARPLNGKKSATLDHVQPKIQGGQNVATNAVLACKVCNAAKGGMTLTEWAEALTRQLNSVYDMLASYCESGKGVQA